MATLFLVFSGILFCHSPFWVHQCLIAGEMKSKNSSFSEKRKLIQRTASRPLSEATDQSFFFKGICFLTSLQTVTLKITFVQILIDILIFWNF